MSLDLIKPVWVRHCPKRPQGLAQLCLHKLTIATRMKAARSTPTLGEEVGTWGRRQDMVVLTHAQLTDALRGRCTWHWYWKSTWTAFKYSPAWAHNFYRSLIASVQQRDECITWPQQMLHTSVRSEEDRGQEQYKVKAIHSHCSTGLGSQMTARSVAVNTNCLKVQERWVKFPKLFVDLRTSLHSHFL